MKDRCHDETIAFYDGKRGFELRDGAALTTKKRRMVVDFIQLASQVS